MLTLTTFCIGILQSFIKIQCTVKKNNFQTEKGQTYTCIFKHLCNIQYLLSNDINWTFYNKHKVISKLIDKPYPCLLIFLYIINSIHGVYSTLIEVIEVRDICQAQHTCNEDTMCLICYHFIRNSQEYRRSMYANWSQLFYTHVSHYALWRI